MGYVDYTKETYIEVIVENFHDYVNNITFCLQKYVDMVYNNIPNLYEEMKASDCKNKICNDVVSFLYAESENILLMRCRSFIYQSIELIKNKFANLAEQLNEDKRNDVVYLFSEDGFFFFLKELDNLYDDPNWIVETILLGCSPISRQLQNN